jgi:ankyrin repeat protein
MSNWSDVLKNNDFLSVKKMIKNGTDINETNEVGESVLARAIKSRCDIDLIMLLVENGADIYDFDDEGVGIFDMAVTYNIIEMIEYMINEGIDVNFTRRRSKFTPLMAAASYGRIEIVKLLIEHGVDIHITDDKGFSATDFARKMNKRSILKVLESTQDSISS